MHKKIVTNQKVGEFNFKNKKDASDYMINEELDVKDISEKEGFYFEHTSENQETLRELLKSGLLNILSSQEYKVFHLMFREGFTLQKTGNHLEISRFTVQGYLKRIGLKLRTAIELELDYQYK